VVRVRQSPHPVHLPASAAGDEGTTDAGGGNDATTAHDGGPDVAGDGSLSPDAGDSGDACKLVKHQNGFGGTFEDCLPVADYGRPLALDACESYGLSPDCASGPCSIDGGANSILVMFQGPMQIVDGGHPILLWYYTPPYTGGTVEVIASGNGSPPDICPVPTGTYR